MDKKAWWLGYAMTVAVMLCWFVHLRWNNSINLTNVTTIHFINRVRQLIAEDATVGAEVERRRQVLRNCAHKDLRLIREKQLDLFIWATLVNNGGALLYVWLLLPIFAIWWAIQRWRSGITTYFRHVESVVDLPEERYRRDHDLVFSPSAIIAAE